MSRTTKQGKSTPRETGETLPEWLYLLSDGDDDLFDVLFRALVAGDRARRAVRELGDRAPRTCLDELKAAEGILDAISSEAVPRRQLAKKAAQAVRKFGVARMSAVEAALLRHVVQIGHVPGPREVVFIAQGAMPYAGRWDWLVVALARVLGVKLPASVRKAVQTILDAPRSRGKLPLLPVVVRSGGGCSAGRFAVHAFDLVSGNTTQWCVAAR
jgi:hypothetical protein